MPDACLAQGSRAQGLSMDFRSDEEVCCVLLEISLATGTKFIQIKYIPICFFLSISFVLTENQQKSETETTQVCLF